MRQVFQTVELANGTWEVFSIVTGERVKVVNTKAEAVEIVAALHRHHSQTLAAINSIFTRAAP